MRNRCVIDKNATFNIDYSSLNIDYHRLLSIIIDYYRLSSIIIDFTHRFYRLPSIEFSRPRVAVVVDPVEKFSTLKQRNC